MDPCKPECVLQRSYHCFCFLFNTGEFNYWGEAEVPLPPTKLENQRYFSLPRLPYKYDSLNIQTTAYALLTYVSRQELHVDPIVAWLNAQRLTDGGWASSQDTGIAMKALTEYSTRNRVSNVTQLAIKVEATSLPGETKQLYITRKSLAQQQFLEVECTRPMDTWLPRRVPVD